MDRRFHHDAGRLARYWLEDEASAQHSLLGDFPHLLLSLLARLINRQDVVFDE